MSPVEPRSDPRKRLVVLAAVLLGGAAVGALVIGPLHEDLIGFVEGMGLTAPIVFVVLYAVLSLALVPGSVLTIAAGVLFGPFLGTALAVVGGAVGATGAFLMGRRLGRLQVERLAGRRVRALDRWLGMHGVATIAVVRIVPGVPYSLLNYAAGVTGISTRDYVYGSAIGLVPGAFVYAAFGSTIDDPLSPAFGAALAGIALFLAAGTVAERWLRARDARPQPAPAEARGDAAHRASGQA